MTSDDIGLPDPVSAPRSGSPGNARTEPRTEPLPEDSTRTGTRPALPPEGTGRAEARPATPPDDAARTGTLPAQPHDTGRMDARLAAGDTGSAGVDPPGVGRAAYVRHLSGLLWPAPARVSVGRERESGRPRAEYLLIPDANRPKLLVPAARRAAAAAVTGFNAERSPRAAALSRVLRAALRTGVAHPLLRDRLRVYDGTLTGDARTGAATIESHLSEALGRPVLLALHIGPARANRKPVAQLLTADGRTVGFTKIGVNPLTAELVRAEARALDLLSRTTTTAMTVPAVRSAGRWQGLELLTLDALPVWKTRAPVTGDRLVAVMREIADIAGVESAPLTSSAYWKDLNAAATALGDEPRAAQVRRALGLIGSGPELTYGSWHGDFALWNLAVLPDTVLVWDWERFTTGVPRGYDALHYHFQDATATRGRPLAEAIRDTLDAAPRLLAPFGHDGPAAGPVALLYLCDLAVRYLRDRQDEAGAAAGRVEEWLLPELLGRAERLSETDPKDQPW